MIDIKTNIAAINAQIQHLLEKNQWPNNSVTLLAVSKKQPVSALQEALAVGQKHFAENYLQEALLKIENLQGSDAIWHFIGAIQSNKTRPLAENFQWVHSVDRLKIAQRLSEQRPPSMPALNICLQVNIDADPAKSGVLPEQLGSLAQSVQALPGLKLRGLMTITAKKSEADVAGSYARMRELFETMRGELNSATFDTLSMGMSADWQQALEQGATMLRIGTAIFGPRSS